MTTRNFSCLIFILLLLAIVPSCDKSASKSSSDKQAEENAQINAETAKDNADAAKDNAEAAKDNAEAAKDNAEAAPEVKPSYVTEIIEGEKEITLPGIEVKIALDDEAKDFLIKNNETIIVRAFIETDADDLPEKYEKQRADDGVIGIDEIEKELTADSPETVIHHFTCQRELYDVLSEKDKNELQIVLSVFSGRKSSPNNVLVCDNSANKLSTTGGKTVEVPCKLLSTAKAGN